MVSLFDQDLYNIKEEPGYQQIVNETSKNMPLVSTF